MSTLFAKRIVAIATSEIGVKEVTQNSAPRIETYQDATSLGPGEFPWCAAFVSWCLKQILREDQVIQELIGRGLFSSFVAAERWRCKSARVFDWIPWARSHQVKVIENCEGLAKRGDFVIYDFSHIGLVAMDQLENEGTIVAIEGNTNTKGSRDGDGVYAKTRKASPEIITCYLRVLP